MERLALLPRSVAKHFASEMIRRVRSASGSAVAARAAVTTRERAASSFMMQSAILKLTPWNRRIFCPKALRRSE